MTSQPPLTTRPLPAFISEEDFVNTIIDLARLLHCRVAHFRPAHTGRGWRTPMQGDVGFPDLVISRDGWVIVAEAKRHNGRLTPGQRDWLAALGAFGREWRPVDWPSICRELRDGPDDQREAG